ncbi:glycine oxidase ThiO [Stackebrandtia nassauensis]|uniref:glycine oxidase n=1 Tax=Stackebrandtia nassauensis (strain DSM 44728 / CIP 108903 / NRRL B-16338 / NBRC 102104 / LLR-40K-21) TaxID=446470 RepID=D3Q914_STANL|nr:glycine oxidase ThiO [Stackebrandtia nassauensis]ADD40623.1 glycine oxidase ThiO [Stackebrandtia nassauensis DSM 44728]
MTATDIAIAGAGIIGLSIARELTARGMTVTVHDPEPGSGASTVAAGMLAPVTESQFGEEPLSRLSLASAKLWPEFAAGLGITDAYRDTGTIFVGVDAADAAELDRQLKLYRDYGLACQPLSAAEARQHIPLLSPSVSKGLLAATDHQVDTRRVHAALLEACRAAGVNFVPRRVTDPSTVDAGLLVVAAGSWSAKLLGLPVRPVRGQVVRLRGPDELGYTVRARVRGRTVYVVPRASGEVVIGATQDDRGFDTAATAGDTNALLRDTLEVLPELAEYELAEVNVGLRPGTPDNAPLLGRTADPRVVAATGHFRQGILLAPITAALIGDLIATGTVPEALKPFDPLRFDAS